MKVAVMQPYLFPYLGYFQLINAVDRFVLLDDANYIKKGWVNRNRILVNGEPHTFTVPLSSASQNKKICDLQLSDGQKSLQKLLKTIGSAYARAPYYQRIEPMLQRLLDFTEEGLTSLISESLRVFIGYLGIDTEIQTASVAYENNGLRGQRRILDICSRAGATVYVNNVSGQHLYDPALFESCDTQLKFLTPRVPHYKQFSESAIPNLSIIDCLMFNSVEQVRGFLDTAELS